MEVDTQSGYKGEGLFNVEVIPEAVVDVYGLVTYETFDIVRESIEPNRAGYNFKLDLNTPSYKPARKVLVNLMSESGELIESTTTDNSGYYQFDSMQDNDYKISVSSQLNYNKDSYVTLFDTVELEEPYEWFFYFSEKENKKYHF